MASAALGAALRQIHRLYGEGTVAGLPDDQLLARFAAARDEAAFEALVARHGPMVLGTCRAVLRDEHAAEDAFQATFLTLARKAGSLWARDSLGGWLHRVAFRIAVQADTDAGRRRRLEREVSEGAAGRAADEGSWGDWLPALHEEIDRLPEAQRAPIVLCYLQEMTYEQAALHLGWTVPTLRTRLARARERLRGRLSRRGLTGAGASLAAMLGTRAARAAVPDAWARAAVKAATGGAASATVVLSEGIIGSILAKLKLAAAACLAAGAVSWLAFSLGATGADDGPVVMTKAMPSQAAAAPGTEAGSPAPETPARAAEMIEIDGRVLDTGGKPIEGATIALAAVSEGEGRPLAVSGPDGRFHASVARKEGDRAGKVAAAAEGFGIDWADLDRGELTLRLPRDDVPVEGRVLDLEGNPVAGATARVVRVGKQPGGGGLGPWAEANASARARGRYINDEGLDTIEGKALARPTAATTGADGRFRLAGFGRERVLHLAIEGPGIERTRLWAITRSAPIDGARIGNHGLYPARFDHVVGPSRPIVGTVRDRRTGKPVAKAKIAAPGYAAHVTTDAEGRYRLEGVAKSSGYVVSAGGGEGVPYFDLTKTEVADWPGLEPITVDFELERGIEVTGRLTDAASGRSVRGNVWWFAFPDNPHRKDYATLDRAMFLVSDWGRVGADGTFAVLAIPGPGVLVACALDVDRYALIDGKKRLREMKILSSPARPIHRIIQIDPDESDPKSLARDISLDPGRPLTGKVVGADGEPLIGAYVAGLGAPQFDSRRPDDPAPRGMKLEGATFTAEGVNPKQPRALVFYHPEEKLGKVHRVSDAGDGPVTVRLEGLASVGGRILDARGHPWSGLTVRVGLDGLITEPWPEDLPNTELFQGGLASQLGRVATTDKDGRFRAEGLLPGLPYGLNAFKGEGQGRPPVLTRAHLTVGPGRDVDLGDLKSDSAPDESSEAR
jgi:RNA polymerase sigma factor (sigma-70 family)